MTGIRRDNKKAVLCTFAIMVILILCFAGRSSKEAYSKSFFAMDTYMTFTVYDDSEENAQAALEQAQDRIWELEAMWSVTDPGSDIYEVNHGQGQPVAIREETAQLISFALEMAKETDGALEPTLYPVLAAWGFTTDENQIPSADQIGKLLESVGYDKVKAKDGSVTLEEGMMLDLGAVGKGYAGDQAELTLRDNGITSALLDIGGNIQAIGTKPDGSDWNLGLRDPFGEGIFGVLRISDSAVVTSGNYERYFIGEDGVRYGHIVDPDTGYPVDNGLASVTAIAGEGKLCDALSTSLFVMGFEQAVDYWESHQDFEMILVTEDKKIYITEKIKDKFNLQNEYEETYVMSVLEID